MGGGLGLAVLRRGGCDRERVCVPSAFWACAGQVWVRKTWLGMRHVKIGLPRLLPGQPERFWKNTAGLQRVWFVTIFIPATWRRELPPGLG